MISTIKRSGVANSERTRICLQADIFLDVCQCLDRSNIEKCQLVCMSWKELILNVHAILPLRKFMTLIIVNEEQSFSVEINHKIKINTLNPSDLGRLIAIGATEELVQISQNETKYNEAKIRGSIDSIFEEIVLYSSIFQQILPAEFVLNIMKKLFESRKQKFQAITFRDVIMEKSTLPFVPYTSKLYPGLFDYLDAEKFYKHIIAKETESIVSNISCLTSIPAPPRYIELLCNYPITIFHEDPYSNVGIISLMDILEHILKLDDDCSRFSLKTIVKNFNSQISLLCAKMLKSKHDLNKLPHEVIIEFDIADNLNAFDSLFKRLYRERIFETEKMENILSKKLVFIRKDLWKLTMELKYHEFDNNLVHYLKLAINK